VNAHCSRWRADNSLGVSAVAGWDHDATRDESAASQKGDRIGNLAKPLVAFFRGEAGALADARDGRNVLRLILASYESNDRGARVQF
jgi:hypothetical protein